MRQFAEIAPGPKAGPEAPFHTLTGPGLAPAHYLEREIRYLIRRSDLRDYVALSKCPSVLITQSYFPREDVDLMVAFVRNLGGWEEEARHVDFSQARIRSVRNGDTETYYLQVKGHPKPKVHSERAELSVEISRDLFKALEPRATEGTIKKRRFIDQGMVFDQRGNPTEVKAEIDILIAAGTGPKLESLADFEYALIEFEHPAESVLELVRSGETTFDFLAKAVELTALEREAMRPFSMRRIAKHGTPSETISLARKLCKSRLAA